jgi:hypothetical protein
VALDVDHIDDHRQDAMAVDSGVGIRWTDKNQQSALLERYAALHDLAESVA